MLFNLLKEKTCLFIFFFFAYTNFTWGGMNLSIPLNLISSHLISYQNERNERTRCQKVSILCLKILSYLMCVFPSPNSILLHGERVWYKKKTRTHKKKRYIQFSEIPIIHIFIYYNRRRTAAVVEAATSNRKKRI